MGFTVMAVGYALRNSFSVFYPTIVEEFGWGRGNTAIMFSLSVLVYGMMSPVAGRLVDRFEPRLILSAGAGIVGGGIALCSLATTQWHFYLLYGVMGAIGLSMLGMTPLSAIVANWFFRKRGLVFGILSAGFGVSLVSASGAQFLISRFGWQAAYVIIGIFAIALLVPLVILFVRRSPRDKGLLPDGMPLRPSEAEYPSQPERTTNPQTKWTDVTWTLSRALKTHQFWLLFLISFFLMGFAEQITIAHQVYFFRDAGYQPMTAATIYSVFGILFVVGNLCSSLSDRFGREKVFIPSCLLSAGAVCLLFLIKDVSQPWMPFLFAVFFGLGLGAAAPVFFATVADLFHGKDYGSIQGFITLGFSLGGTVSPWLAGFLYDRTGSYSATFFIIMGALVTCAVLMRIVAPCKLSPAPSHAGS